MTATTPSAPGPAVASRHQAARTSAAAALLGVGACTPHGVSGRVGRWPLARPWWPAGRHSWIGRAGLRSQGSPPSLPAAACWG
jgi:hypothetical protein